MQSNIDLSNSVPVLGRNVVRFGHKFEKNFRGFVLHLFHLGDELKDLLRTLPVSVCVVLVPVRKGVVVCLQSIS
jgi:hypothetical protein